MSQENVEIVRRWIDGWVEWFNSRRDAKELAQIYDQYTAAAVIYQEDPVWPDAGVFRGRKAVLRRFLEYVDLLHIEGVNRGEVIDAGDSVLAEVRIEILGSDAGEAVEFLWGYTVRIEEGRVAHFRAWYDRDEAARAVGLRE
jgi:ketosteroid isomerase-like protein